MQYIITTIAGTGTTGNSGDGGAATSAQLNHPAGVSVGISGIVYISDTSNNKIRTATSTGVITTFAGTGVQGSSGDNGVATSAQLYYPSEIATDSTGNLYIADRSNNKIRLVTNSVQTLSVSVLGTVGMSPWGAVSGNQNAKWIWMNALAASDSYADYAPYTFFGSFVSTSSYTGTIEVCADNLATVYVNGQMIQYTNYFTWEGGCHGVAGNAPQQSSVSVVSGTNKIVVIAQNLGSAAGLLLSIKDNNGNYVYSTDNSWKYLKVTSIITTFAGTGVQGSSGDGGVATSAQLYYPSGIALDSTGNLYIADTYNHKIRMVTNTVQTLSVSVLGTVGMYPWWSVSGNQNAKWIWMNALAASDSYADYAPYTFFGSFVSTSSYTGTIEVCADNLATVYVNGQMIQYTNYFTWEGGCHGVAGNAPQQSSVSVVSGTNKIVVIAQNLGSAAGLLLSIKDNTGNYVYSTDSSWKYQKITSIITTLAGTGVQGSSGDGGVATSAQFNYPRGISVGISGIVYIADSNNNKIRMVASAGIISTVAGTGATGSNGDGGAATSARLCVPSGVTVSISGNVYIADYCNNKIRMVTSTGIITTFAGTGAFGSSGDGGEATSAQLYYPTRVSEDISGNVYIADYFNIRMVVPPLIPTPQPTMRPTMQPTQQPSQQPTRQPSRQPAGTSCFLPSLLISASICPVTHTLHPPTRPPITRNRVC